LAKKEDSALNSLIKQTFVLFLSGSLTIVGWIIKNQIDNTTKTVSQNKERIDAITRDALLGTQKTEFNILMLQREIAEIKRQLAKVQGDK
jgi:hypothetical protein